MAADQQPHYWTVQGKLPGSEQWVDIFDLLHPDAVAEVVRIILSHASDRTEEIRIQKRIRV